MNPALGPFAIAALLLVVGGVAKALRPHDTAVAIERMGLRAADAVIRVGGCAEALLGVIALAGVDVSVAALVATSYAIFCGFVSVALARRLPVASCGCFGRADTPPTPQHVALTAGACVAAIGMAFDVSASPLDAAIDHGAASAAYAILVTVGVLAAYALLAVIPRSRVSVTAR